MQVGWSPAFRRFRRTRLPSRLEAGLQHKLAPSNYAKQSWLPTADMFQQYGTTWSHGTSST